MYQFLNKTTALITLMAFVIAFIMGSSFQGLINHAPLSDDLSMIAFSHELSWDWATKGLADYFIVYPEYYTPQSNFIRPISNLVYWIFGALIPADFPFLSNQIQLLVLNYGMLLSISTVIFVILFHVQNSRLVAICGALSCLLIPTFWTTPTPTYTSFVFDGLSTLFCLMGLWAFGKKRLILMASCLTLALLTKEIAFPVLAGFGLFHAITKNLRALAACAVAIMIWLSLRLFGFGLNSDGVYVFDNFTADFFSITISKLRNIFMLPFGPITYEDIYSKGTLNLFDRSTILLVLNAMLYVVFASLIILKFFKMRIVTLKVLLKSDLPLSISRQIVFMAGFAAFASFVFDAYVGANYRYAYNFLPFLFIVLAGANIRSFPKKILFFVLLIGSIIASFPSIARLDNDFEATRYGIVRDLFKEIRKHEDSDSILILNDVVLGYANPRALEVLAPTRSRIIRGTSLYLDACSMIELTMIDTRVTAQPGEIRVAVDLPDCGRFTFESSPRLREFVAGNKIRRNDILHYEFLPDRNSSHLSVAGWTGQDLTIVVKGPVDIMYFDFKQNKWIFLAGPKS